mmetsp:Transcript_20396/g.56320  ORF Transcript_20396/g.56320 Transcript_20396/m.56320 type:complete len:437 (-) Transcript_20396:332-1642(-)
MSRSKRSHGEVHQQRNADAAQGGGGGAPLVDEAAAAALAAGNHSDSSSSNSSDRGGIPKTPSKKVRLNLTSPGGSAVEETKAIGEVAAAETEDTRNRFIVTPGNRRSPRKKSTTASETPSSLLPTTTAEGEATPARRALFTPPNAQPQLVTPSKSGPLKARSPAKRRLVFGRYSEIEVEDSVKKVYGVIKKLTGSIGGNASNGPIYGELTMGSMQKMVNLMKRHTKFDESSRFIDVGSGIGKPNFHVTQDPGVDLSYGLEIDADRWLLSMNCLRGTLDLATTHREVKHKCIFVQGDIRQASVFDPFTHVYMFSIGFPPALWISLAEMWNRSTSPYLICFHSPKDVVDYYDFEVELLDKTPTSMHGSKEGHTGYIYRRKQRSNRKASSDHTDPFFAPGIDVVNKGLDSLKEWTNSTLDQKMSKGPSTRASRCRSNES